MLSSFTKDEKRVLLAVLGIFAAGWAYLQFQESAASTAVFTAGPTPAVQRQTTGSLTTTSPPPQGALPVAADGTIDLNTADAQTLDSLPGIGPSRAEDIIAYRNQRGGFRSIEELDKIGGIGGATMEKLRPHLRIGTQPRGVSPPAATPPQQSRAALAITPPTPSPSAPHARAPASAYTGPSPVAQGMVNINTATTEQLESLDGIGPALAGRIIDFRTRYGGFSRVEDLDRVRGIGPATIARVRHRVTVR